MAGKRRRPPGDAPGEATADAASDDSNHRDTGCEKLAGAEYRSCLACPLVVCIEDLTGRAEPEAVARRQQRAAVLAGRGRPLAQIARSLGVSSSTVKRDLAAIAPAAGRVRSSRPSYAST